MIAVAAVDIVTALILIEWRRGYLLRLVDSLIATLDRGDERRGEDRICFCPLHAAAEAMREALEETAKFLGKVDRTFDHSGAMNATQLARRDHYLRTREAVHTALASATPEGA